MADETEDEYGVIALTGATMDAVVITPADQETKKLAPGKYRITYKGKEKLITVSAGKITNVNMEEPAAEKAKVENPTRPPMVEGSVETGVNVTSVPDQLQIYVDKKATKWKTPEILELRGTHIIGVTGKVVAETVTIPDGTIVPVKINLMLP